MDFSQRECGNFATRDTRQVFLFLLFCSKQEQRLRDTNRLMRRYERGYVSVPTAKQHCRASVIALRQTKPAVFLRNFDSKRADFRESFKIFGRNFAGAIDLVRIDMFAQITFQLADEIFARGAIFGTLRGIRVNSIEIVATNKEIAGETAAVLERIARGLSQLERLALAFGHL